MRRFSKTLSQVALGAACITLTACGGHGPNTYLMPKDALVAKLDGAERDYSMSSREKRSVKAYGRSGDDIKVRVSSSSTGSTNCTVEIEAIDEDWTRATPVCPSSSSATDKFEAELDEMQVDEWVLAVLYDREVDTAMVLKRTSAVMIDNFGDVTKEVGEEMQALAPDVPSSGAGGGEWGTEGGSDWGS